MARIIIKAFGGLNPISSALLLSDTEATVAKNTRLVGGTLAPLAGSTTLKALTKTAPATIWRYGNSGTETEWWLEFLADTDVIRSPTVNDAWGRTYWADGVEPRYAPNSALISGGSYPGASYRLGIPAPVAALSASGTAPASGSSAETRTYVYTYVSAYGEEGPPSAASVLVTIDPGSPVNLSGMSTAPSGSYNITKKRIYRSSSTTDATAFQFVAEIPVASLTYSDSIAQAGLGEVLPTEGWSAPPAGLKGLKLMASGAAIGFAGNTVHMSEPFMPHAWPHAYPIDLNIVGIGVTRQSAIVLTTGYPYLMSGVDPASMSTERLELAQACLSKASIVETGDGVIYASPDGLVSIGSSSMSLLTQKLLTAKQWQAYNPASIKAFFHDGRYHAFYTKTGGTRGGLIFDFTGQGATLTETDFNTGTAVSAGYADPRTDTLYLAQGTNIVRFNTGSAMTLVWRSKLIRLSSQVSMGAAALDAAAYPMTVRVYAGGVLKHTQTVTSAAPFRLPTGFRSSEWQLEIEGTAEVTRVRMATSIQELRE